ncbi:transcriptional regulator [Pantoea rodasii]|uniref:Transcriptional regulator n=2 Tax=Pantoea rodasii TaxID=1076549 RepID=A0A2M9W987_9GAMM|nr:transcriptional regulator [Pantoea rodasii]
MWRHEVLRKMHQKSNEQDMLRQFNMECQSSFPERELLNSIALQLINKGSRVTHKSLILQILTELELEKDNKKKDLLRSTLEMVVGGTPDDEGF